MKELDRVLTQDGHAYFFCDGQSYPILYATAYPFFKSLRPLIWDKQVSINGYGWRHQHELILFCQRPDAKPIKTGDGLSNKTRPQETSSILFPLSDGYSCVGLVEPAFESIQRKMMIEEAGANSAYQRWMNPLIGYVGDDRHPPTTNLTNQTLSQMKNMKHDLYSVYPYYVKLETLKSNPTEAWNEMVKYLRENQSASSGMPMPLATGPTNSPPAPNAVLKATSGVYRGQNVHDQRWPK